MEHEAFVTTVMSVVALLFIAAVSAVITRRIRFPYTIGLVVIGVAVAFFADDHPDLAHALDALKLEPVMIMFLFIPILIFESAFNTDVPLLMRNLVPSLTLAGPGLLISTALIGGLIYVLTPLPLESALVFGSLISATDPVAVIALFKEVGAPKRLNILMEGESVFNDATAIVTFQIILAVIASGILDVETITGGVIDFISVFFGGLLVGLVFGQLLVQSIRFVGNQPLVHITLTLVAAYGAFIVADHFLHTSGIMAVLVAGLTVGYYGPSLYQQKVHEYLEMFWEDASFVANSLIFLMLGLSEKIFLAHTHSNPEGLLYPVLIAIAVVVAVRFIVIYTIVPVLNHLPGAAAIDGRYRLILSWGGLRGAVAIALAMSLPAHFPYRWQIIDFTFGVTLFTLLVNGTTMSWLIRRLKLDAPSPETAYLGAYATAEATREALQRLLDYTPVLQLSEESRDQAVKMQREKLERTEALLNDLQVKLAGNRAGRRDLLWLQAVAVQQTSYMQRYADGLLSRQTEQTLERTLKNKYIAVSSGDSPDVEELWLSASHAGIFKIQHVLEQMLPDLPCLARFKSGRTDALAEKFLAVIEAAKAVLGQMDRIAAFSAADPNDICACQHYYEQLEKMGHACLDKLIEVSNCSYASIRQRMLSRLVQDARLDVINDLERSGRLPEELARNLRDTFEAQQATGEKSA